MLSTADPHRNLTELVTKNVAQLVPNPALKRREIPMFASVAEVEAVADELAPEYRAIPIFCALTGMRPSEWLALERSDIDGDVVHIRRVYVNGELKLYGKQRGSLRAVPLPARAKEALSHMPRRLDTRVLFPSSIRDGRIHLPAWRRNQWDPAVRAAGLERRTPYALRHTYASLAIAAGVNLFELSRFMGTSVAQIDATYGHLLPDALDRTRTALDLFISQADIALVTHS